jgi:hypothetical protein
MILFIITRNRSSIFLNKIYYFHLEGREVRAQQTLLDLALAV